MASVLDLYNAIVSATQVLSQFSLSFPRSGGNVTVVNNLSSAGFTTVISSNNNRNTITFVNPGPNTLMIAPTTQGSSNGPLTPTAALLGGAFPLLSFDWVTLAGQCKQGFQAMATSGSSQPLTIMDQ